MKKILFTIFLTMPLFSCFDEGQNGRISKESYIANLLRIKAQDQKQEQETSIIEDANQQEDFSKQNHEKLTATEFVVGSEDIPLFQGLNQAEDDGFNLGFDSESGSISSSSYANSNSDSEVKSFYLKTLPQMGWILLNQNDEHLIFKRENKTVDISFLNQDGQDLVRFFISAELQ